MNARRGLFCVTPVLLAAALACVAGPSLAAGAATCTGKFPNPITDICWSCILPLSIGGVTLGDMGGQVWRFYINNGSSGASVPVTNQPRRSMSSVSNASTSPRRRS